jgi:hypothetical protein
MCGSGFSGKEARMDRDALRRELTAKFHESLEQAMNAVEQAPDGAWIAGSEWQVREAFQKLPAQAFERIVQEKLDTAGPAVFSPSPRPETAEQRAPRPGRADRGR